MGEEAQCSKFNSFQPPTLLCTIPYPKLNKLLSSQLIKIFPGKHPLKQFVNPSMLTNVEFTMLMARTYLQYQQKLEQAREVQNALYPYLLCQTCAMTYSMVGYSTSQAVQEAEKHPPSLLSYSSSTVGKNISVCISTLRHKLRQIKQLRTDVWC